jgi:hypothetical protein
MKALPISNTRGCLIVIGANPATATAGVGELGLGKMLIQPFSIPSPVITSVTEEYPNIAEGRGYPIMAWRPNL